MVAPVLPILGVSFPFTNISFSAPKPLDPAYPMSILTLGDHIRTRRLDLGLLQKQVAERIGVDTDTVINWEQNRCEPKIQYLPTIIDFLGYVPFAKGDSFPERLKVYRKLRGLTQQQLADKLGVAMLTVRTWEAGTHQPRPKTRKRVEEVIKRAFESMYEV